MEMSLKAVEDAALVWDPESWAGTLTNRNKIREALRREIDGDCTKKACAKKRRKGNRPVLKRAKRVHPPPSRVAIKPSLRRREYKPAHLNAKSSTVRPHRPPRPGTAEPRSSRGSTNVNFQARQEAKCQNRVQRQRPTTARVTKRPRYMPGSLFGPVEEDCEQTAPMC